MEARKNAAGMVVVKEFAAKLHVQFIAKFGDAFLNVLRLNLEVFPVIEPVFHIEVFC